MEVGAAARPAPRPGLALRSEVGHDLPAGGHEARERGLRRPAAASHAGADGRVGQDERGGVRPVSA
jgi:hypothetical protein